MEMHKLHAKQKPAVRQRRSTWTLQVPISHFPYCTTNVCSPRCSHAWSLKTDSSLWPVDLHTFRRWKVFGLRKCVQGYNGFALDNHVRSKSFVLFTGRPAVVVGKIFCGRLLAAVLGQLTCFILSQTRVNFVLVCHWCTNDWISLHAFCVLTTGVEHFCVKLQLTEKTRADTRRRCYICCREYMIAKQWTE